MTNQTHLQIEDFEYDLPAELIAQAPLEVRHESKLLHLDRQTGKTEHLQFSDIVDLLRSGDVLVINNTKVVPARLIARRASGGQVKLLLLKFDAQNPGLWEAMVTPIKRLKPGEELTVETPGGEHSIKIVEIFTGPDGFKRLRVDLGRRQDVYALLSQIGNAPLPPYIRREDQSARDKDIERYQTAYATVPGAVAAPTAGLHFTEDVMRRLREKGVQIEQITLHVGAGTFKPIEESVENHTIESENFSIPSETAEAINAAKRDGRRVIAVGTTTLRALEAAANAAPSNKQAPVFIEPTENGSTDLYVKPGFNFRIIDGMVTNFHVSRSSLLVLVSAVGGRENILRAYNEAIERRYRFFSYGDAMLIL